MTQIVVHVENQEKARLLYELLRSLDFVTQVDADVKDKKVIDEADEEPADFFSLMGIWKERDISLEKIRQQAWPKRC